MPIKVGNIELYLGPKQQGGNDSLIDPIIAFIKMAKKKEIIGDPIVIDGHNLPVSLGVRAGDFVFFSPGCALDKDGVPKLDGGIEEQTALTVEYIQRVMEMAGCTLEDVVSTKILLKNKDDFSGLNEVYRQYFSEEPPARATVLTDFMVDGILVEIQVTAYKPQE